MHYDQPCLDKLVLFWLSPNIHIYTHDHMKCVPRGRGVQRECYTLVCHKIKTVHYKHNGHLISLAKFCDVCDDHPPKHHTQN